MTNYIHGIDIYEKRAEKYKLITNDVVCCADICVVGSGAAGAILATKLAKEGKSVVLLEKGGYYDGESMNQRESDMLPLLWKNAGANFTSNLRIAVARDVVLGARQLSTMQYVLEFLILLLINGMKKGSLYLRNNGIKPMMKYQLESIFPK